MKSEQNRRSTASAPTSWQREAPCACVRIETSPQATHLFPYQHLVSAFLSGGNGTETLRLSFSSHDVEIAGRNLRPLLLALQDFAVKWLRAVPQRYEQLAAGEDGVITSIKVEEVAA